MNATETTANEIFTANQNATMARLIWLRFGRDAEAATAAWNRMMQNNCSPRQFMAQFEQ